MARIKNIIKITLVSLMMYGPHIQSAAAIEHQSRTALFPIFGHYQGGGYHFMHTSWSQELNREIIEHLIPLTIKNIPNNPNTTYFVKISGTYGNNVATDSMGIVPQPWNVIFHGWSKIPTNTSDNVQMGLFEGQGVTTVGISSSISYNHLQALSVNPHDQHYSPNNARFQSEPNRQFMTFGLAALYKDRSIATYEIVINNQEAQQALDLYISSPHTDTSLAGITDFLQSHEFKQHFKNQEDIRVLDETIKKLYSILKIKKPTIAPIHTPFQEDDDEELELALAQIADMEDSHKDAPTSAKEETIDLELLEDLSRIDAMYMTEEEQLELALAQIAAMND